jgi:hypothetical protein
MSATCNFHIRLRASGPRGMNVRTAILQHAISISAMRASGPCETDVWTDGTVDRWTSFVSILASFCVWTKSLMCKDAVNRDSTCQSIFRRLCTVKKIEDFSFPVSRSDDVSSRPDAHLSTVPSVRTTCSSQPDARHTSIIRPDDVSFLSRPYTVSRSFCSSLHPSGHLSSPSGPPLNTRTVSNSFQVPVKGRSINRLDDVVSRPDARLLKARIAIQMSPS